MAEIDKLERWLKSTASAADTPESAAHREAALAEIERFRHDPAKSSPPPVLSTPPGQPVGEPE